jgi:hypothetical protein
MQAKKFTISRPTMAHVIMDILILTLFDSIKMTPLPDKIAFKVKRKMLKSMIASKSPCP